MPRAILLTRHQAKEQQAQQRTAQETALGIFEYVYNFCANKDVSAAIEFIQCPGYIGLYTQHYTAYVLHAALSVMNSSNIEWTDILNNMDNFKIAQLQKCINDAKRQTKPNIDMAQKIFMTQILGLSENQDLDLSTISQEIDCLPKDIKSRAKNMFVVMIAGYNWQTAENKMNSLSKAIINFERKPQKKSRSKPEKTIGVREIYDATKFAAELGYCDFQSFHVKWCRIRHQHPEIDSYFTKNKGQWYIYKDCKEDCEALFVDHRRVEHKKAKKNNPISPVQQAVERFFYERYVLHLYD